MTCSVSIERTSVAAVLVAALAAGAAFAQLRISPSIAPLPPPSCSISSPALSTSEVAEIVPIAPLQRRTTYLRPTSAGAWLRIEGVPTDGNLYEVTIRSKLAGWPGLAPPVCASVKWTPSRGAIVATDRRRAPGSVWQVELVVAGPSRGSEVRLLRPVGSGQGENGDDDQRADLFALSCDDWSPTKPVRHRASGFATRVRLDAEPPRQGPMVGQRQLDAISDLILSAAALWGTACRECQPENLAVIGIGGRTWARQGVLRWLKELGTSDLKSSPAQAEAKLRDRLESNVWLTTEPVDLRRRPLQFYSRLDLSAPSSVAFCASAPSQAWGTTLTGIHAAICSPASLARERRARIALSVRPLGATYCGDEPDIIACRADDRLTELNARDFRFRVKPELTLGSGPVELDLLPVLVHEMGHWIGLRHLDRGTSIMASTVDRARCIDEATIGLLAANLNAVSAGPQAFRLHARSKAARHRPTRGARASKGAKLRGAPALPKLAS